MNHLKTTIGVLFISACLTLPFALMTEPLDVQAAQYKADVAECKARKGGDAQLFILDGQHLVCRAKKTVEAKL